jgi:hypothetical protein
MALEKTVTTTQGFRANNAYHRVEEVLLQGKQRIKFVVRSYLTKENPSFNSQTYFCSYDLDGENPIKQAYKHLKTLEEFAGATDC